jgi:hypothetical protein
MIPHAITVQWLTMGGPSGTLGAPLGESSSAPAKYGTVVDFAGGVVYSSATLGTQVILSQSGDTLANNAGGFGLTSVPRIALAGNRVEVVGNSNDANDMYANVVTVYRNSGDLIDSGITVRLEIYWTGGGLYLTTPGPWVYTKYFPSNSITSVSISGSTDNNTVTMPAGIATLGFQAVHISGVPGGNSQPDNSTTCGPNSASRVMQAYGSAATYGELIKDCSETSWISANQLGTTASTLVDAMNSERQGSNVPVFSVQTNKDVTDVINLLQQGKPVVAMVRVPGDQSILDGVYTAPQLHWIAVTGYDVRTGTIYYTDTDGSPYQESFNDFDQSFSWWGQSVGEIPYAALNAIGVVEGTLIA